MWKCSFHYSSPISLDFSRYDISRLYFIALTSYYLVSNVSVSVSLTLCAFYSSSPPAITLEIFIQRWLYSLKQYNVPCTRLCAVSMSNYQSTDYIQSHYTYIQFTRERNRKERNKMHPKTACTNIVPSFYACEHGMRH